MTKAKATKNTRFKLAAPPLSDTLVISGYTKDKDYVVAGNVVTFAEAPKSFTPVITPKRAKKRKQK